MEEKKSPHHHHQQRPPPPFEEKDTFKDFCTDVLKDLIIGAVLVTVAIGSTFLIVWLLR